MSSSATIHPLPDEEAAFFLAETVGLAEVLSGRLAMVLCYTFIHISKV